MTALIIVLLLLLVLVLAVLAGMLLYFWRTTQRDFDEMNSLAHLACAERIARLVSAKHDAALLRVLADEYDSVRNQTVLERMRYTVRVNPEYATGDRTIPALWLRNKADEMDPPSTEDALRPTRAEVLGS